MIENYEIAGMPKRINDLRRMLVSIAECCSKLETARRIAANTLTRDDIAEKEEESQ